jgi:hypothetical protein
VTLNNIVSLRSFLCLGPALLTAACALGPLTAPAPDGAAGADVTTPAFSFADDTFAFANDIRARHPGVDDLYANYCFVLARALRQFNQFARFEPGRPRLDPAGYVELVRRVAARGSWAAPLRPEDRVVIPGYASLREFSRAEEAAVKEGLGGRFWTLLHWTNWRVAFFVTRAHQANVAHEIVEELRAGRLVQLLVTNWPKPELNHTVVAFEAHETSVGIDFGVWDPNDPAGPGVLSWQRQARAFWATRLYDTEPGAIRVFRMYFSRLL